MLQHKQLSNETQLIVANLKKNLADRGYFPILLVSSLYALRPEAESHLVQALTRYTVDLSEYLNPSQIAMLQEEFSSLIIGDIWEHPSKETVYNSVEFGREFFELCRHLSNPKQGESVYFPHAASGPFLLNLDLEGSQGFESDEALWALSQIRLKTLEKTAEISLGKTDLKGQHFDHIFYPLLLSAKREEDKSHAEEITNLFTEHLNDGGHMVCVLLPGFAFRNDRHWIACRRAIVELGFSATLINLPNGLLSPHTSVGICILMLQNDKRGEIRLVDATYSRFATKQGVRSLLNLEAVKALLSEAQSEHIWSGISAELNDNYSFWPGDYLTICRASMLEPGDKFYALGDLLEFVKTPTRSISKCTPRGLRISDLKESYHACDIEVSSLDKGDSRLREVVTEDCLVISYFSGKIKVGRLLGVSPENPVSLGVYIYPVRCTQPQVITEEYLLRAILSELTLKQADAKAKGGILTRLDRQDLMSLQVIVPSLSKQGEQCHADAIEAMRQAGLDVERCNEEFRRDMHLKKHAIGQSLFNLNNWWTLLKDAREKNNGCLEDRQSIGTQLTVADVCNHLDTIISKLSVQLSKFDTGYGLSKTEFRLLPFLQTYVAAHQSPLFSFEFSPADELKDCSILFSEEALSMVLDNILSNAATHGFEGQAKPNNTVRIELSLSGTDCIVSVSNNGRPLAEGFGVQDVFRYGQSSGESHQHFGIGGYEIQKLMHEFNAEVKFYSEPEAKFPVMYQLIFRQTKLTQD